MALNDDILKALKDAGTQLKADLWTASDLEMLKQRAKDLAGLQVKAQEATDANKKAQYKLAGTLVVDHVKMTALTRMHVAEQHAVEALGRFFLKVAMDRLAPLLPFLA